MKSRITCAMLFLAVGAVACQPAGSTASVSDKAISKAGMEQEDIVAEGAMLQRIAKQFSFTEGPATDDEGNVFFTDQPDNKIWKYDTSGKLSVFMDSSGRANGLYFDREGNLLACADEQNQLWSISPEGKVKVLVKDFQGHQLNGPNDVWVAPNGGIYFTDPYYQRDYWQRQKPELAGEKVYYLGPGQQQATVAAADVVKPNGLVGTPDGRYLYVADIGAGKTYKYKIGEGGSLQDRQLFVAQGSDGMTIDDRGNVYLAGNGVTAYNPAGEKIKHIPVPANWTANVTFGGKHRDQLFITASEAVYTLQMNVKGVK